MWVDNKKFFFSMLVEVYKGVYGFVKDKIGKLIFKVVIVFNEGIKVYIKEGGYFYVFLVLGVYNINVIVDGY